MATGTPLPHRPPVESVDGGTRVVELGTDETDTLCAVLASETARTLLTAIEAEPRTASDVADHVDTSLQNALYHLRRLREAGLVTVVDTWYSSRGSEMKVYDTAHSRLVFAMPTSEPTEGSEEGEEEPHRLVTAAD
jgi:DNA-binding transcriptional ArsR family regulator